MSIRDPNDTQFTWQPLCPFCKYAIRDAWELDFGPSAEGETEIECPNCEKTYVCSRHVEVTYCTTAKPETTHP